MSRLIDETNKVYNDWTVLSYAGKSKWLCKCNCGKEKTVAIATLKNGTSKNCGCKKVKHGFEGSKIYRVWSHMKERCYRQKHKSYKHYGGRGIKVCSEWLEASNFIDWAFKNGYQEGLTIERIDNNGNYEPSNCTWITNKEQQRNKRNNRFFTIGGETKTVSEWAEICGLDRHTLLYRINKGEIGKEVLRPTKKGGGL